MLTARGKHEDTLRLCEAFVKPLPTPLIPTLQWPAGLKYLLWHWTEIDSRMQDAPVVFQYVCTNAFLLTTQNNSWCDPFS